MSRDIINAVQAPYRHSWSLLTQFMIVLHLVLILLQPPGMQSVSHAQGDKAKNDGHKSQTAHTENIAGFRMWYHPERQHKNRVNPNQKCFHGCALSGLGV